MAAVKITIVFTGMSPEEIECAVGALGGGARAIARTLDHPAAFMAEGASDACGAQAIEVMRKLSEESGARNAGPEHDALADLVSREPCPDSQAN